MAKRQAVVYRQRPTIHRAVGYARVSTDKQADDGSSLEAQETKLRAAAVAQELELVDVIVDAGLSGKNLDRPGMARVLSMVKAGEISCVIVPKLDRLSRSVLDILHLVEMFEEHGVSLLSLHETLDTKTPMGRFVLKLFASLAEMEREQIIERVKEIVFHKKAIGERVGTVPYGFRLKNPDAKKTKHYTDPEYGVLVEDMAEQVIITRIRKLRKQGLSLQAIADDLNAIGYRVRNGSEWRNQYVDRILRIGLNAE